MSDAASRERLRRSNLLELRKYLDARTQWKAELAKQEAFLSDPKRADEHERAARLKDLALRLLAITEEQIENSMTILNIEDDKEELERQLAALDD